MPTNFSDNEIKSLLSQATEQVKAGALEKAMNCLKEILRNRPDHEISMGMLASIYLQIGMHEEAVRRFEGLLASHPENPLARFQLGMARLSMGEPESALKAWKPLLTQENDFMAHFHSALALMQLAQNQEALAMLSVAARHMPSSHPLFPKLLDLQAHLTTKDS